MVCHHHHHHHHHHHQCIASLGHHHSVSMLDSHMPDRESKLQLIVFVSKQTDYCLIFDTACSKQELSDQFIFMSENVLLLESRLLWGTNLARVLGKIRLQEKLCNQVCHHLSWLLKLCCICCGLQESGSAFKSNATFGLLCFRKQDYFREQSSLLL